MNSIYNKYSEAQPWHDQLGELNRMALLEIQWQAAFEGRQIIDLWNKTLFYYLGLQGRVNEDLDDVFRGILNLQTEIYSLDTNQDGRIDLTEQAANATRWFQSFMHLLLIYKELNRIKGKYWGMRTRTPESLMLDEKKRQNPILATIK